MDRLNLIIGLFTVIAGCYSTAIEGALHSKNINRIVTKKAYSEYTTDAMNIEKDDGLPLKVFEKKWDGKFDIKPSGFSAFMLQEQDCGYTGVNSNILIVTAKDYGLISRTVRKDTPCKGSYKMDIKLILSGRSFLIADVLL